MAPEAPSEPPQTGGVVTEAPAEEDRGPVSGTLDAPPGAPLPDEETLRARLGEDLAAARLYPPTARRRGIEGTVQLTLKWGPDGSLTDLGIGRPSGSAVLDQAALELVRSVFPRPNPLGRELRFQISLEYRLTAGDNQR